jgi:uncharacterized small protein (DUF1192 family)
MTVLMSGYVADKVLREAKNRKRPLKPKSTVSGPGPLQNIDRKEFRNGGRYHGLLTRVAKTLGVSPSSVQLSSRGACHSKRIIDAIVAEIRRTDAELENSPLPVPLTALERAEFSFGGKYYGVSGRVAKSLGMLNSNMHRIVRGKLRTPRVLAALRKEMARVDALPRDPLPEPLTKEEIAQFKNGRKYYGLYTRVAQAVGMRANAFYHMSARSSVSQPEMIRALRAEMARVDAELAAKGSK